MHDNLILKTDSYKLTHWAQLRPGTTKSYSYLESRGGEFPFTQFFSLQILLKKYLTKKITLEDIFYAKQFCDVHIRPGVFNEAGWQHILNEHGGFLPLEIKAVPEGTVVPIKNVLMTIENTDDKCAWLTNYVESLLMKVWSGTTVATHSLLCKQKLLQFAGLTGSPLEGVNFKMHDFGYRGVSSEETAGITGAAHLLNFSGSDNIEGIRYAMDYYNWNNAASHAERSRSMPAYSVVATEHGTATPWGRGPGERDYVLHILNTFPEGIVSVVGDSYNIYGFATLIGTDPEIKAKILARDGCFVVRPDSGDPVEVVLKVMNIMWENFGGSYTDKGFRLLNPKVRVIQGDGIDMETMKDVLQTLYNNRYASDNVIFGSGGALLQKFNRDTQKFAIKCSLQLINSETVNVQKDPATSLGKKSKQGYLKLHHTGDAYMTISSADESPQQFNAYIDTLRPVFRNGQLLVDDDFETVRKRSLENVLI